MLNTIVSNSDSLVRQLQSGFAEAVASHPMLMVGGVAGALAMIVAHWVAVADAELPALRSRRAIHAWPIRPTR